MSRVTGRNTRPKKLTAKQNVHIFREEQVDNINDQDALRTTVETGVEKGEESEYHLQQSLQAAFKTEKVKDAYIPTPPTISSDIQYDILYPKTWQQPNTYIRSSATVEDCNVCSYCMDEEDELALKLINAKLSLPITEDHFEEVMTFFEDLISIEQPFASVHNAPIMSLEEMLQHISDTTPASVQKYAKVIYEHWSSRRSEKGNSAIPPQLKSEAGKESDDADPYVTFRRREIRQTRKTRHRDEASRQKLRDLRMQLEQARNLLLTVKQREQARKDCIEADKQIFEQRQAFRELKRKLKQPGDDDLLITQKKPKLPPVVPPEQQLAQQIPSRTGPELKTLEDLQSDKRRAIENEIQLNVEKHKRWNEGYHDFTMNPLSPDKDSGFRQEAPFLPAMPATLYLPTPPASISEDEADKQYDPADVEMKDVSRSSTPFRYASPDADDSGKPRPPAFRRRYARGGRLVIDRRVAFRNRSHEDDDRFRYDHDSDEEMDDDPFPDDYVSMSTRQSNERSILLARSVPQPSPSDTQAANARRAQIEAANAGHAPAQPQQVAVGDS